MSARHVPVVLASPEGESELLPSALDFASDVEREAPAPDLTRSAALRLALERAAAGAGATVTGDAVEEAVRGIQQLRRGAHADRVVLRATGRRTPVHPIRPMPTPAARTATLRHFEVVRTYPDPEAGALYDRLSGLDDHKRQLLVELELLLFPDRVAAWSKHHHRTRLRLVDALAHRVPLVIFEGDVGTGKTALAETVGDALARHVAEGRRPPAVHLLKVTTQVRGSGLVGEMSKLIGSTFDEAEAFAVQNPGQPVLLLLDEADALASSRASAQMHHEDRAGLNTLIQRLDNLRLARSRVAALFITNRPDALDPAVRRRAALVLRFERPTAEARRVLIQSTVPELALSDGQLDELVLLTGERGSPNVGPPFTASDIADRLFSNALRVAYTARRPLCFEDLAQAARSITPTPRFKEE